MKTKNLFLLGCIGIAMLIPGKMLSQNSQTTTGYIKIITPITLAKDADMNFGVMSGGATGGTCVLGTDASRTPTGNVKLSTGSPVAAAGAFTVAGNAGSTYAITLPASFTVVDGSSNSMTVNQLTARPAGAGSDITTGTLTGGGTQVFTVGGTITINPGQVGGEYQGDFVVSVDYN